MYRSSNYPCQDKKDDGWIREEVAFIMNILKRIFKYGAGRTSKLVYGATDVGRQRDENEDCFLLLSELDIYIVADGMGGYNAGDVASLNAVKIIGDYLSAKNILKEDTVEEEMTHAIVNAHRRIAEMGKAKPECAGMGSTVAVAFIRDYVLHTCHVGDSRVYVIDPHRITQITNDHSTVTELIRRGKLTREEARHSKIRNEITQALGAPVSIKPEYNRYTLTKKNVVLLCSDGLWEMLPDEEIQAIVTEEENIKDACKKLIQRANAAGGTDNITAVLIQMGGGKATQTIVEDDIAQTEITPRS